jgi:anti-sigma-K factor RskA
MLTAPAHAQAGGSPNGQPTSAPVFAGKLIETVPPARK